MRRTIHVVNLDPAAEHFDYPVAVDIRELISLDDVMEELELGPNGGLIYCMEHLEDNLDDWLTEELDNYLDDDYLVFDCPGQIELFSHVPVLKNFVEHLKRKNFNVCAVYLLDSQFVTDVTKFISGCMASLSAMVQLEVPHVNILSKMDLVKNKRDLEDYLNPEPRALLSELNLCMAPQFEKLNKALIDLVDEYSMVSFIPLDLRKESSIQYVLAQIDNSIQYGEDADVKDVANGLNKMGMCSDLAVCAQTSPTFAFLLYCCVLCMLVTMVEEHNHVKYCLSSAIILTILKH
ncbi:hypothetical protein Nepgr_002469 [Nepenthes gracilis]|uniref:GPN-loop GTPase 3 n=1 Tax=Nepenthes gracilis TaxID=150966 RepID=A0AAD3P3V6_NEPGR|nr:hypothetical protein Nepgr_002469 [Nepenthes gracilis]